MPKIKYDFNQLTRQSLAVLYQLHTQRRLGCLILKFLEFLNLLTA